MNKNNRSLKTIFTEALEHYRKRDLKTAEIVCYKILSIDPNHFDAISLLANISAVNQNFDKAKEFLNKAIEIQPKNTSILNKYIQETKKGKKYLIKNLNKLGFSYHNSYANFLLVDFKTRNLKMKVWNYMKNKNILISGERNIPGCKNFLRFTLGPVKYMKLITNTLNKLI